MIRSNEMTEIRRGGLFHQRSPWRVDRRRRIRVFTSTHIKVTDDAKRRGLDLCSGRFVPAAIPFAPPVLNAVPAPTQVMGLSVWSRQSGVLPREKLHVWVRRAKFSIVDGQDLWLGRMRGR